MLCQRLDNDHPICWGLNRAAQHVGAEQNEITTYMNMGRVSESQTGKLIHRMLFKICD